MSVSGAFSMRASFVAALLACAGCGSPLRAFELADLDAGPDTGVAVDTSTPDTKTVQEGDGALCSPDTPPDGTNVVFVNHSAAEVQAFHVDNTCTEIPFQQVAPNGAGLAPTALGHVWRVRDVATGRLLGELVVTATDQTLAVGP